MTEEQKARRKENRKRWYNNHKEQQLEANRKVYQRQKENNNTWQQRNKDKVNEYNRNYRNRKIKELREKGIKNAWSVYINKKEPKYEDS